MGWLLFILAYFVVGIIIAKRYYRRRHGVAPASGARGSSTAGAVGLAWPATLWFSAIRNPRNCNCHYHVPESVAH